MPNFSLHARFTTKPDKREQFISKFKEIAAHAKQHEPNCLAFHLSVEPGKPNSFALFELSAHQHSAAHVLTVPLPLLAAIVRVARSHRLVYVTGCVSVRRSGIRTRLRGR